MIFKSQGTSSDLNGFLDRGSLIEGELRFDTSFRVDGKLRGMVTSSGDLIVGEGGEVEGQVHVGRVFVTGTVRGAIQASRQVQIAPGGQVYADVETPSLVMEDGALFEGRCTMSRRVAPPATATATAPKLVTPLPAGKG